MAILGRDEGVPPFTTLGSDNDQDAGASTELQYVSTKGIALVTGLPTTMFADKAERARKRIP